MTKYLSAYDAKSSSLVLDS